MHVLQILPRTKLQVFVTLNLCIKFNKTAMNFKHWSLFISGVDRGGQGATAPYLPPLAPQMKLHFVQRSMESCLFECQPPARSLVPPCRPLIWKSLRHCYLYSIQVSFQKNVQDLTKWRALVNNCSLDSPCTRTLQDLLVC